MTDRDPGTEAAVDDARRPPDRRRTVPIGAFVLAVVVAVAMGVLAVVALGSSADDDAAAARAAAGFFVERLLTFDSESLDEWSAEVRQRTLPSFEAEFATFEQELLDFVRASGDEPFDNRALVSELYATEVDRGTAAVIVQYDWQTSRNGTLTGQYVQLLMVEVDGAWLVSDVIDLLTLGQPGP